MGLSGARSLSSWRYRLIDRLPCLADPQGFEETFPFLLLQQAIDEDRRPLSRTDGVDHGARLLDDVAPGKDPRLFRRAPLIRKDRCCLLCPDLLGQRGQIRVFSDGRDHLVDFQGEVGTLDLHGPPAPVLIRGPQTVLHALQLLDFSVFRRARVPGRPGRKSRSPLPRPPGSSAGKAGISSRVRR